MQPPQLEENRTEDYRMSDNSDNFSLPKKASKPSQHTEALNTLYHFRN